MAEELLNLKTQNLNANNYLALMTAHWFNNQIYICTENLFWLYKVENCIVCF